jgi:hypothetical protein
MTTKAFFSTQSILPPLSATTGALKTLLKTLLVTGAGTINVSTITVASGLATVQHETAHGYEAYNCATVTGAGEALLNGDHYILSVPSANQWTFATTAADGVYSGAITSKLEGLGWVVDFESTNVICLRSAHEDATGCVLRLDDSGTTSGRVRGFGAMTDIDTGTDPFPSVAQQVDPGLYWPKAHNTTGTRPWAIVADERSVVYYVQPTTGSNLGSLVGFGDLVRDVVGPWDAYLAGHATEMLAGGAGCLSAVSAGVASTLALPKRATGAGGAVQARLASGLRSSGVSGDATGSQAPAYPNAAHGETLLMQPWLIADDGLRGVIPGVQHTPQHIVGVGSMNKGVAPGLLPVATSVGGVVGLAWLSLMESWR